MDNPNLDKYDPDFANGTPLQRAVQDLAQKTGRIESDFVQWTLGEILEEAETTYRDDLPEFWKTWRDWTRSTKIQPMGDL